MLKSYLLQVSVLHIPGNSWTLHFAPRDWRETVLGVVRWHVLRKPMSNVLRTTHVKLDWSPFEIQIISSLRASKKRNSTTAWYLLWNMRSEAPVSSVHVEHEMLCVNRSDLLSMEFSDRNGRQWSRDLNPITNIPLLLNSSSMGISDQHIYSLREKRASRSRCSANPALLGVHHSM